MKFLSTLAAAAAGLLLALPGIGLAAGDLLARMSAVNPGLHSYTATMHAHVALSTFPFLSTDVAGTYYHQDPDHDKLEITSGLPLIAQQFGELYPHIEPPSLWEGVFAVTTVGDDGNQTTFRLVPRVRGNINHIDAVVDDKSATVTSMRWNYENGGWASMRNTYRSIGGNMMVAGQQGHVDEPNYKGDITSTFDHYAFNPHIPDGTFTSQ